MKYVNKNQDYSNKQDPNLVYNKCIKSSKQSTVNILDIGCN